MSIRKTSVLTQEKVNKLKELKLIPEIRNLLDAAISGWSEDNVKIANCTFGVKWNGSKYVVDINDRGCCLLGAATINSVSRNYSSLGLSEWRRNNIIAMFDYCYDPIDNYDKQIVFIRDIVFENE